VPARHAAPTLELDERTPAVTTSAVASVLAWFRGGNTIVRVAVLILFVGVAFLVRYAAEHAILPLALRQDALPLAGVGVVGGFAAPLLASTSEGNHVLLFGHCGVLNLGIAATAHRRAWRRLNLVGFMWTSLVTAAWGAVAWQPERLATTEPFLVAHWALFTSAACQPDRPCAWVAAAVRAAPAALAAGE
jgi:uncharacterized membrane protein